VEAKLIFEYSSNHLFSFSCVNLYVFVNITGGVTVHSGQIPKAKILVENRMGNKVQN